MPKCPTCSGSSRETTEMICLDCGTDYLADPLQKLTPHGLEVLRASLAEVSRLRAENTAQAAALAEVARLHQPYPDGGMGYRSEPYPDGDGAYGQIHPCCQVCGTPDEYAAPYPCGTAHALGLDQSGEGQTNATE